MIFRGDLFLPETYPWSPIDSEDTRETETIAGLPKDLIVANSSRLEYILSSSFFSHRQ